MLPHLSTPIAALPATSPSMLAPAPRRVSPWPASLCLSLAVALSCGGGSTEPVEPPPPDLVSVTGLGYAAPSTPAQPGDVITVTFTASATRQLAATAVHVVGAFSYVDSMAHSGVSNVTRTVHIVVPATARLDLPMQITADGYSEDGRHGQASFEPVSLVDSTGPWMSAWFDDAFKRPLLVGDTLRIRLTAGDNAGLAWLGYEFGGSRDSMAVSGVTAERSVAFVLTAPYAVRPVEFRFFARDVNGNYALDNTVLIRTLNAIRRATRVTDSTAVVRDLAYDAARDVLYLSQPSLSRVAALSLRTMTISTLIAAPSEIAGLDLTVGGDSLVVVLRRAGQLGFVDLRDATPTMTTVTLPTSATLGQEPDDVRVVKNNKAMVTLSVDNHDGYDAALIEYDLATRATAERWMSARQGLALVRDVTRERLLVVSRNSCCPVLGRLYDARFDTLFAPRASMWGDGRWSASTDSAGVRFLLGAALFSGSRFEPDPPTIPDTAGVDNGASALSMGVASAYFATKYGYRQVSLLSSSYPTLERVWLPYEPSRLVILPNRATLIALGSGRIMAVDLR